MRFSLMTFLKKSLLCIVLIELLGNLSGLVTFLAPGDWYAALQRPPGTPPNALFGPVWLVIYALMGWSLAFIWDRPAATPLKRRALRCYGAQLVLNLLWTPVFFGLQRIDLAMALILLLLVAIALTIRASRPISRAAGVLLWPYFAWVAYATYLNAGFLALNR